MSVSPYNQTENFDLPRQTTQCWVLIHSHVVEEVFNGVIDCSEDTIQCSTSKTIKGGGNAQITLVPRKNYMNYIFPNDYVDIFFDVGDGRGPIRTFFGMVDRVERAISVNDTGATSTLYHISCSDFTKIFEKTNVYFNPHVANRSDFVGAFGNNIAGVQLRMKGIVAYGTPADIILNLTHLLLGWNGQWVLPPNYPVDLALLKASRDSRNKWAKQRFKREVQDVIEPFGSVTAWASTQKELADTLSSLLESGDPGLAAELAADSGADSSIVAGIVAGQFVQATMAQAVGASTSVVGQTSGALTSSNAILVDLYKTFGTNEFDVRTAMAVEATTKQKSILDLIDFSLVEYESIDGSIVSTPIWTQEGFVWALMNAYSNDIVNELFCDLRPVTTFNADTVNFKNDRYGNSEEGGYKVGLDPILENRSTDWVASATVPQMAVRFAPSLVMREYPFSTITSIDASQAQVLGTSVGTLELGAIFAQGPGESGRKYVKLEKPLNDFLSKTDPDAKAIKHLDVLAITVQDIISENIGRGDADVCNLIELYSDGAIGHHMKFLVQDVQPVATGLSILRNGLRVRTYSTRFGRFSTKTAGSKNGLDVHGTRHKLCRWVMMMDHWYQHNIEYLQGVMTLRAFPELRVGYRLDVKGRNESYYVEGVNQNWTFPEPLTTSVTVSRGQRYDPYPVYVKPDTSAFNGDRKTYKSRLAFFFRQKEAAATVGSLDFGGPEKRHDFDFENFTDLPAQNKEWWGGNPDGYIFVGGDDLTYYDPKTDTWPSSNRESETFSADKK